MDDDEKWSLVEDVICVFGVLFAFFCILGAMYSAVQLIKYIETLVL